MPTTRFTFQGASGATLSGRLDQPADGSPLAYALFSHCFTCSKDLKAVVNISRELNRHRIGVFRFDFTGLGESEGDFGETGFSSNVDDLVAAAEFMARELATPQVLIGHSFGGAAVLQAAHRIKDVRAVVTIGAPYDPSHVTHLLERGRDEIMSEGEAVVTIAGRRFRITKQFLQDLEAPRVLEVIGDLKRALLILHSPVDTIVGIENAALIYEAAKHPKSFVSLDDADHLLTRERDSRYAGAVLAAWASRYLDDPPVRTVDQLRTDSRVVALTGPSGYRTEIMANCHSFLFDEPESVGGTNLGPTPYDLLAAALGACTAMTLRMYADRKGWPLEAVAVGLTHRRLHAEDRDACDSGRPRLD